MKTLSKFSDSATAAELLRNTPVSIWSTKLYVSHLCPEGCLLVIEEREEAPVAQLD